MFARMLSAEMKPIYREIDVESPDIARVRELILKMDGESIDNVVIICQDNSEFHVGGGKSNEIIVSYENKDESLNMISGTDTSEAELMAGGQAIVMERRFLIKKDEFIHFLEKFVKDKKESFANSQWEN
ncbi:hypothetical protein [Inquilinus limosus]|uniref:hypothetical protein n=1 Tax=Inquilinus limosus TaxID=171674 RepID=UPI0012DF763A|nr:hypothetical protein [Inquilinus limosus]